MNGLGKGFGGSAGKGGNLDLLRTYVKGQTKLTVSWHTPNRVNIK